MSDRYLEDGSYIRVKTVTLSYDLPAKAANAIRLSKIRLYVTAQNMFTFTKYTGFDPEVSSFGMDNTRLGYDFGSYPAVSTYIVGASITF
jgi:hypothetical protein